MTVTILKKQKEVAAIYLTGGFVTGECFYGLSDIDLIVIVGNGPDDKPIVEKTYRSLCRFIPLIKYDERGLFTEAEIEKIYHDRYKSDIYLKHLYAKFKLFNETKKNGKLLYGKDIFSQYPELKGAQRKELLLGHLAFVHSLFIDHFILKKNHKNKRMQNYVCYKVNADVSRSLMSAKNHEDWLDRGDALKGIQPEFDERNKIHIERLLAFKKNGFQTYDSCFVSSSYEFYMTALTKTLEALSAIADYDDGNEWSPDNLRLDFESADIIISHENKKKLDSIVKIIHEKYQEDIESIFISPLDLVCINESNIGLFIKSKNNIPFEMIDELNKVMAKNEAPQRLSLYGITSYGAVSLSKQEPPLMRSALFSPNLMPLIFLYVSTPYASILGGPLQCQTSQSILVNHFLKDFLGSLEEDKRMILNILAEPTIVRLSNIQFQLFFWQALRLKLVEDSLAKKRIFVPLSSSQVYQGYPESSFPEMPWLKTFHEEYRKDLNGESSDTETYFLSTLKTLKILYS